MTIDQSLLLTQAEVKNIKDRADSPDATPADRRNLHFCDKLFLLENTAIHVDFSKLKKDGDPLVLYFHASSLTRDETIGATDKGILVATSTYSGMAVTAKAELLRKERSAIVLKVPTVLADMQKEIKKFEDSSEELTYCCVETPTEVLGIMHQKIKSIGYAHVAQSMSDFLKSTHHQELPSAPAPKISGPKWWCSIL